jgi:sugar lactone lactonase YvrE/predicted alpha/beta superfamily hydrolase
VPKGEILKFSFSQSKIFPGTVRDYWVYIPAQYRPEKPASVYISQDGVQMKAPVVFDNLIHSKEMPVTIGVFIMHGRVPAADNKTALDRFNRSYEYDGLGDAYAKFLLEELLPDVEKQKASDGRPIKLSPNGNDRSIGGASSGAICAFTAAWERPDAFSRVFSAIGTYVGLRGGDRYSTLVRKYEPKPIRVYLQDGSNDLNIYAGDWFKANETMERALSFAGYEVSHVWGEGVHNGRHATAIFPQAMRWLWKDYPKEISAGKSKNQVLTDILISNEPWELVGKGYGNINGMAAHPSGEVYFTDLATSKTYKIDGDGKVSEGSGSKYRGSVFSFNTNGYATSAQTNRQIVNYSSDIKKRVMAENVMANDIITTSNGNIYFTTNDQSENGGKIFLLTPAGRKAQVATGLKKANGLTLSPDGTQLYISEGASHWLWALQVATDGTLQYKQRYGWLHVPDTAENAGAMGLKCDSSGRVYVASSLGIQILDQAGRVNAILPIPSGQPLRLCFGGKNFNTIYVSCKDRIYRRKLNVRGVNSFDSPYRPTAPRL